MTAPDPREPTCEHSRYPQSQPASACVICKDGPRLAAWRDGWARYFREHPDDPRGRAT